MKMIHITRLMEAMSDMIINPNPLITAKAFG